ncbi:MAG: hypothetical protein Q8P07_04345 [bacterium]|nr:hypothetical protein [bacterium]
MKNKTQVFLVHGGMTFKNQRDYLHYLKTRNISLGKRTRPKKAQKISICCFQKTTVLSPCLTPKNTEGN